MDEEEESPHFKAIQVPIIKITEPEGQKSNPPAQDNSNPKTG